MCNECLKRLIINFRNGDDSAFYDIIEVFKKLIHKFSYKLKGDDTFQDLSLTLLELVHTVDLDRFPDIALAKEKQCEDIVLDDLAVIDSLHYHANMFCKIDSMELVDGLKLLNDKQRSVIIYRYVYCYSDNDIANKLNISRQAVNRLRNIGLKILADFYCE